MLPWFVDLHSCPRGQLGADAPRQGLRATGQITKLKFVKRQMYGRGKFDLLEAHPIATACKYNPPAPRESQSQNCTPIYLLV